MQRCDVAKISHHTADACKNGSKSNNRVQGRDSLGKLGSGNPATNHRPYRRLDSTTVSRGRSSERTENRANTGYCSKLSQCLRREADSCKGGENSRANT